MDHSISKLANKTGGFSKAMTIALGILGTAAATGSALADPQVTPPRRSNSAPSQVPRNDDQNVFDETPRAVRPLHDASVRMASQNPSDIPPAIPDEKKPPASGAPSPLTMERTGKVSLHANERDIREILELISREASLNLLVSPGVSGTVSVNLDHVTVDQALQAVIKLGGLQVKREGSLAYVYSAQELEGLVDEGEIVTSVFQLNYVKSSDNSMSGGEILVVQDHVKNVKTIEELVLRLDIQPIQVMVEAVLLSVELTRQTSLGINFGILNKDGGQGLGVFGNGLEINANAGFTPAKLLNAGKIVGGVANGFLGNDGGFKYGFIDNRVTGFIRALESVGDVNILASPRVLVLNKQRAEIQLGQRLGYATNTQNLTTTTQFVQFLNTGTLLRFRPYVSTDGMIRMEVHPEKSTGAVVNNLPTSNISEVTTNVMVPDGATIVIGGLIENTDTLTQSGTLGLSRLPVVGPLFRGKNTDSAKRELIVMLTPRIWNPGSLSNATGPIKNGTYAVAPRAGNYQERVVDPDFNPELNPYPTVPPPPNPPDEPMTPEARLYRGLPETQFEPIPTDEPSERLHLVRSGENFWTISKRYYGSGRYYKALWSANKELVDAPERLEVGMRVSIPEMDRLDVALIEPASPKRIAAVRPKTDDALQRTWLPMPASPSRPSKSILPSKPAKPGLR